MKILAIRGSNLASLDGEFSIDFTTPNFIQDGLIAITGSTGAGKSTILDALCLALFNRIPRLPTRGSQTLIGRADEDDKQRLASHDVRYILRRGTGEGYAEVDFLGVDKKKYRATWTIRRARKRADGRFQSPEHLCIALHDEKPLGRTRKEIEEIIVDKLGLNFDQFRRSVLLAQGDFASFLKADAATRSRLLEMITGTEVYGEISRLAHQRANEENAKLKELQTRLNEYDTLDNDARNLLKHDLAEQEKRVVDQQKVLKQWQQQFEQLKQISTQQSQLKQAIAQQKEQQQTWQSSQAERNELQQLKQLEVLRVPLQRFDDAQSAYQKILSQQKPAQEKCRNSEKQLNQLHIDLSKKQALYQQAETKFQQAKPELRQAYKLDDQRQQLEKEQQRQQAQCETSQKQVTGLEKSTQTGKTTLEQSQKALSILNKWLQQHQNDEVLASQWQLWESLFDDVISKQEKLNNHQQQKSLLKQEQSENVLQLKQSQEATEASQQQLKNYETRLEALDEEKIQSKLNRCTTEIQSHHAELAKLKELETLQQQYAKTQTEILATQEELEQLQTTIKQAEKAKQAREKELIESDIRLDEANRKNRRALLATGQSAEELRAQLSEGEACSVCGSREHPFHTQGNEKLHSFADMQHQRVQELQSHNDTLKQQLQQAISEITFSHKQQIKQTEYLQTVTQQSTTLLKQWQGLSEFDIVSFQADESIASAQQQLQNKLAEQQELNQQQKQLVQLHKDKDVCLHNLGQQQIQQQALEKAQQKSYSNIEHCKQQITELQTASQQIQKKLNNAISHLNKGDDDLSLVKQRCLQQVEKYQQQQRQQLALEKQITQKQTELEKQAIELQHARDNLQQQNKTRHTSQQQLKKLSELRNTLFVDYVGQSTEAIEQRINTNLKQSKTSYEKVQQKHQSLKETLITQQTQLQNLQHNQAEQSDIVRTQKDELEQALKPFELSETTAREKLNKDTAWIKQQEQKFEQLKKSLHTSQIHVQTASQKLAGDFAFAKQCLDKINLLKIYTDKELSNNQKLLEQQLNEAEQACTISQKRSSELQFQLREDNNKRKQAKKLQKAYDKQDEISHIWKVMKELIGSQTGDKFRKFAQSLTLEILLSHTNQHLQELNRRYALQRVPQTDLELQIIDKEMGDEIRPVHSLSGGESFLVSLALALGLASLSSRKTQIDSLFIDEGFGTLDPQTLDTALSALDSLQSQGKTVCIISHVTAITERVAAQIRVQSCGNGKSYIKLV